MRFTLGLPCFFISFAVIRFATVSAAAYIPEDGCLQLLNCTALVTSFSTNGLHLLRNAGTISPGEILDTMCSLVDNAHECIHVKSDLCPHRNYMTEVANSMEVADYACELRNRDFMIDILSSECAQNDVPRALLIAEIQGCTEAFLTGVQSVILTRMLQNQRPEAFDFCPVVDELKVCFINHASNRCGNDFTSFLRKLWTLSLRSDLGENMQDCFQEVKATRKAMERYIPTLSKTLR